MVQAFRRGAGLLDPSAQAKSCREFNCLWLTEQWLGPEWKPSTSKFVLTWEYGGACLSIMVDPKAPNAWKAEPYQRAFRALAEKHAAENRIVMVVEPNRRTLVMPDQDMVLGGRDDVFAWEIVAKPAPQKGFDFTFDRVVDGSKGGPTRFDQPVAPPPSDMPTISFSS